MADPIAIYGAAIGSAAAAVALLNTYNSVIRDRSRIVVDVAQGVVGLQAQRAILVTAINKGRRPVTLKRGYLRLRDGSSLSPPLEHFGATFPRELTEGTDCLMWFEIEKLKHTLAQHGGTAELTHACFADATDRVYCRKFPKLSMLS